MRALIAIKRHKKDGDYADSGMHHHHHTHHHYDGEHKEVKSHAVDYKYGDSVEEVLDELANPPRTWASYGTNIADLMAIIAMEYQELMAAKAEGNEKKIEEELEDLAAACIHAHKHL